LGRQQSNRKNKNKQKTIFFTKMRTICKTLLKKYTIKALTSKLDSGAANRDLTILSERVNLRKVSSINRMKSKKITDNLRSIYQPVYFYQKYVDNSQ
jgi:hypothetical protein